MKKRLKRITVIFFTPVLIFVVMVLLIPFLNFSFTSATLDKPVKNIKIIAHRGAAGLAPENTISAFAKAMEYNVDMVELDVHLSADDSVIVMHDHNVKRTTNGEGEIEDLTYDYIKGLDAGSWYDPKFSNEKVPTLREVLQFVNGRTTVLIELKWPKKGTYKNLVKNVLQTIKDCHAENWVVVQSFEQQYLKEMNQAAPGIPCHQLVFAAPNLLPIYHDRSLGFGEFEPLPFVRSVNISYLYLNKKFIQKMHDKNMTVYAYTLDSEDKMSKAINLGIDGIITNRPDVARELLK